MSRRGTWRQSTIMRLGRTDSFLVKALITYSIPTWFFSKFYSNAPPSSQFSGIATVSFDCDHRADIAALPTLLDILDSYDFTASFACIGTLIERYPAEHRLIVDHGHEVVNHTHTHPYSEELGSKERFDMISKSDQRKEILECHRVCKELLSYEPIGFRIPHFGIQHTDAIYPILSELGYKYSTSILAVRTKTCGLPYSVDGIWEFPISTCPRHPFQAFDTYHAFRSKMTSHRSEDQYFETFKTMVSTIAAAGGYLATYFDPQDMCRFNDFGRFLDLLSERMRPMRFIDIAQTIQRG